MTLKSYSGVPKIIHQTWKDKNVPRHMGNPDSWKKLNPDWEYCFWTDKDLRDFMQAEFPDLLSIFDAYPLPVQRADLGRYCLLWRFGGVYADVDTDCIAPLEPLVGDHRVILCEEPPEHSQPALVRGLARLWFNGTMASPAGHPFWGAVVELCRLMAPRSHRDVLETTGPLLLSAAIECWPDKQTLSLNSCNLFAPMTVHRCEAVGEDFGPHGFLRLSRHNWSGSWYRIRNEKKIEHALGRARQWVHFLTRGKVLDPAVTMAGINKSLLQAALPPQTPLPQVAIFVPVRDGAKFLLRNIELIRSLDYPKHRLRIVYCEGDSRDDSAALISEIRSRYGDEFAEIVLIHHATGLTLPRANRWRPALQRHPRSMIAQVRNTMLRKCLKDHDDWVLWLDVDVCEFSNDVLKQLLEVRERIVIPNCVLKPGGASYDLNAFLEIGKPNRSGYYRHIRAGLFHPPADYWFRRHLDDLRYLSRVPLHGVGGTMLLVQADIHRAGLIFPELPYKDLIETEGFGYLARDMGITPIGLPNVEIRHVES